MTIRKSSYCSDVLIKHDVSKIPNYQTIAVIINMTITNGFETQCFLKIPKLTPVEMQLIKIDVS